MKLLTRDEFRDAVFERDGHKCVFCGEPAQDAHHILERRLWPDGGYYLSNGASVCGAHHLACEYTTISVEEVREACGIEKFNLPPHLYDDQVYDKWGNIVQPNGTRLKGELFHDESVQKALKEGGVLGQFVNWVKYPRTHHCPWSSGITDDDRVIGSTDQFMERRVIVTEKMDGENTTLYRDYYHARSIDGRSHPSRDWAKNFWSNISHDIPEGWRVCCENLFAQHSIAYDDLPSYLMGFSVWNEKNVCLDWDTTMEWFQLLGIEPVPVLYDGVYSEGLIKMLGSRDWERHEGYVVRLADEFSYGEFKTSMMKFVRRGHVQTTKHWMHGQAITQNGLQK